MPITNPHFKVVASTSRTEVKPNGIEPATLAYPVESRITKPPEALPQERIDPSKFNFQLFKLRGSHLIFLICLIVKQNGSESGDSNSNPTNFVMKYLFQFHSKKIRNFNIHYNS